MSLLHRMASILRWLFRRDKAEQELHDELQVFIDLSAAEKIRAGVPPAEARRSAALELGGVEQAKERVRTYRHGALLDELGRDLRYAFRIFGKNPAFVLIIVLILALGAGANTAIFSLMNAVMLKSLPVREPERLVEIRAGNGPSGRTFSNPVWEQIQSHQELFDGAIAYSVQRYNLASGGQTRFVDGLQVNGSYFEVLGIKPIIGRMFTETDDRRGCGVDGPTAVLSYRFWQGHYGGVDVLGKPIALDGRNFTIIGVSPPQFFGVRVGQSFDVATPICATAYLEERGRRWLRFMARLKPGMQIEEAENHLRALQPGIREATRPSAGPGQLVSNYLKDPFALFPAITGSSSLRDRYARALFVLMTIAVLVMLVTCGNIASLLLARATARTKEIAVRLSLGAGRSTLIRQLLIESLVLSLSGAALGIVLAPSASRFLANSLSTTGARVFLDVSLDWRVVIFTLAAGLITGLLFGIIPAVRVTRWSPAETLREIGGSPNNPSRKGIGSGRWLVSFQMGLSLVLIFGATLFIHSYWRLRTADHGFDRSHVLLIETGARGALNENARLPPYNQILDVLRATPGVQSAAYSFTVPVGDSQAIIDIETDGSPQSDRASVWDNSVSPEYFKTLGTALIAGRDFDSHDVPKSHDAVIVNEAFAHKFFPDQNPLGKVFRIAGPKAFVPAEIIGLVQDAKYDSLRQTVPPTLYDLAPPTVLPGWVISVRMSDSPSASAPALVEAIGRVDKNLALTVRTFQSVIDDSLVQERLMATLSAFFGILALTIAAVGLAGLVSYSVTRRRTEIGIRAALGATSGSLVRLVMRDVIVMTLGGLVSGTVCGLAAARIISMMLYEIRPNDPITIGIAGATLAIVAAVAGYLPARRAARIDPMDCLRLQ